MYVILVSDDNTLSAPKRERIMQRSKLVDNFWWLVPQYYKEHDMEEYTLVIEYLLPVSKKYKAEIMTRSPEKYEDHLKYVFPIDTELTAEAGEIELQPSFIKVDLDADGNSIQRVRKLGTITVEVLPIAKWSDVVPDNALSAIDQRIIKTDAQIKALEDMHNYMYMTKADGLAYDNNQLQLTANGEKIGNTISIKNCEDNYDDGVPVVDFTGATDFVTPDDSLENKDHDNVVEFDPMVNHRQVNNVIEF